MSTPIFPSPTERRDHVLELRGQGLTYREIGDRLGVTASRARQLYFQAERLREDIPLLPVGELSLASPVSRLPISRRARKALEMAGIRTLGDVAGKDRRAFEVEFLSVPNGSRRTLDEIFALLDEHRQGPG